MVRSTRVKRLRDRLTYHLLTSESFNDVLRLLSEGQITYAFAFPVLRKLGGLRTLLSRKRNAPREYDVDYLIRKLIKNTSPSEVSNLLLHTLSDLASSPKERALAKEMLRKRKERKE